MRPVNTRKGTPTFAFVVDGQTEIWYLEMFKKYEQKDKGIRINIKPEIPQKKKLEDQFSLACDQAKSEFDKVFWIIDLDVILKETRESRSPITPLDNFIEILDTLNSSKNDKQKEVYEKINVIVNNPCLEYWFLLHYEDAGRTYKNCSEVTTRLKRHLRDYNKTERYFKKKDNDIYTRLKPYLTKAIKNAETLGNFDKGNPEKGMCEMHTLFLSEKLKKYFEE